MNKKDFRTAIFDMDETLVEIPASFELNWTKRCFESFSGKKFSEDTIKDYLRLPIPERGEYLRRLGFSSPQQYLDMWLTQEALDARFVSLKVYDDTPALLELKDRGLKLGLVTAAPQNLGEMQKSKLERHLGISDLFDSVVYIHGTSFPKKPNPCALNHCISDLFAEKQSTFYCGNLDVDIQMANNAEVTPVLIERYNRTNLHSNPISINSLSDLRNL